MMEPLTYVTGGLCIAMVSGIVGRVLGNSRRVKNCTCEERRKSCQGLLIEKIDNLTKLVKSAKETD